VSDDSLRETIRELPREQARPGFTARVLARIDRPGAARARPRRAWAIAAAVTLSAVTLFGGLRWQAESRAHRRAAAARAELAAMQREHARLAAELEALLREPGPRPRVVLVGGDDRAELVIDLDRLAREPQHAPGVRRTSGPVVR
jgi:cytochrome c-type biogenesis protein CcmH/NrfG